MWTKFFNLSPTGHALQLTLVSQQSYIMSSLKSLSRNTANTEAHTGCFCNWNLYKFTYFLEISCEASWQSGQITTYFSHERIPWKKWFYSSLEITRFIFIIWSIQSDNQSLTNMQFLGPMPTPILGSKKIPIWIYRLIYTHVRL